MIQLRLKMHGVGCRHPDGRSFAGLSPETQRSEAVPDEVKKAYPGESFEFGSEYIIPKPFDPRVLLYVAPAVAKAAMDSGVARNPIDLGEYDLKLNKMLEEIASL